MREIKFRVWDNYFKRWNEDGKDYADKYDVYAFDTEGTSLSSLIGFIQEINYVRNIADHTSIKTNGRRYTLVQYTGLKDKNGKEIYEGDIIKCVDEAFSVEWEFGCFALFTTDRVRLLFEPRADKLKMYEVIGNIYSNPELLK